MKLNDEIRRSTQLRTLLKRVVVNRTWKKISGPYGIWTHDLCDTGAVLRIISNLVLFHIYLPKSMLALWVIKLINALQFTLLCRMWAQHSKIYRIWPAFCGICIWRSPRLNDGSSRRYQKLGHDWHFEALFEKKGSHFFPNNKTRSSTCLWSGLSGQWMTLLIFILVLTIPSTVWVIPLHVTVQYR